MYGVKGFQRSCVSVCWLLAGCWLSFWAFTVYGRTQLSLSKPFSSNKTASAVSTVHLPRIVECCRNRSQRGKRHGVVISLDYSTSFPSPHPKREKRKVTPAATALLSLACVTHSLTHSAVIVGLTYTTHTVSSCMQTFICKSHFPQDRGRPRGIAQEPLKKNLDRQLSNSCSNARCHVRMWLTGKHTSILASLFSRNKKERKNLRDV